MERVNDSPFAITVTQNGLAIAGDIDAATAPTLRAAIRAAADTLEAPPLHVDMSDVSFMDSSGLSALIVGYRSVRGGLRVVAPSRQVARVLEVTGTYDHFVGAGRN
jgi:anti-sigma B factor antagonist